MRANKSFIFLSILIVLAIIVVVTVSRLSKNIAVPTVSPTISPTASPISDGFCKTENIEALIETEGAAGSIYENLTLKNISNYACKIIGNNTLVFMIEGSPKNIKIVQKGSGSTSVFSLEPGQIVYSHVRIENGPQCSKNPSQKIIKITYAISLNNNVYFLTPENKNLVSQICTNPNEITEIDTWPMSINPVN